MPAAIPLANLISPIATTFSYDSEIGAMRTQNTPQILHRLILIAPYNPNDVSSWSGTPYSIYRALKQHSANIKDVKVDYIRGGLRFLDLGGRSINKVVRWFGFTFDCRFCTAYALLAGIYLTVRLLFLGKCTLLVIAGSTYLPFILTKRSIIYISDATFRSICTLYPEFKAFPNWLKSQGDANERRSLLRSQYKIYSSRWAGESARLDYGVSPDSIFELQFGPNIDERLIRQFSAPKSISPDDKITLIFVSADWKRKGGDMVIDICRQLIAAQLTVRLITVGDTAEYAKKLDFVNDLGFLRKSNPVQLAKLCEAYAEAHFLILPTLADASPVVFSEAQAFGCPSITYDVGGTSSMVLDRETGIVMPLGTPAKDFADRIQELARAPQRYEAMSRECLRRHKELANWEVWARTILRLATTDERSSVGQSSTGMAEIGSTSVRTRAPGLSLPEKGQ